MKSTRVAALLLLALLIALSGCLGVPDEKETLPLLPDETQEAVAPTEQPPETIPLESEPPATAPSAEEPAEPEDETFVLIRDYIPNIFIELPYAGEDNFTGQVIYECSDAWLRYGTVKKLMLVQEELGEAGLCIKLWDAFRPMAAQFKLWEVCPDPAYVSDPLKGSNSHSRGNTVDITLAYADGTELTMPTGFDDFSALADRDYSDCSREAAENALLLERIMESKGFKPYSGEWWHFSDMESYPVEENFQPAEAVWYYADCREYINLRTEPSSASESVRRIPVGEEFLLLAWDGDFAYVQYQELRGYVLGTYIAPVQG